MPSLPMPPAVFAILTGLVREETGLHFDLEAKAQFCDRVSSRAVECGFDSLLDYYYLLRYDDEGRAELQRLVDALVVNETYFFRELDQLEVAAALLAERARASGRARAWSAACATGEEPLSLAMLLAEHDVLSSVELVATDISARALARATSGRYGQRSLRSPPPRAVADRWLEREGNEVVVRRDLIDRVRWSRLNLLEDAATSLLGGFDVVLCRNVLIYFDDTTARGVIERLARQLVPGGALFVGVSESLIRLGVPLKCTERQDVFFYEKEPAP